MPYRFSLVLAASLSSAALLPAVASENSIDDYEPNWAALACHARMDLARGFIESGEYAAASLELEKNLAQGGDPFSVHAMLSTSYLLGGDIPRAKAHLVAAHILNPNDPDLLALEGQFELAMGDRARGEALLERLVSLHPETDEARILLARSYLQREAADLASQHLTALAGRRENRFPTLTSVLQARQKALAGDYALALTLALQAYAQDPSFPEGVRELGFAYLHIRNYVQAKPLLERAFAHSPRDPQVAYALGELNYRLRDWVKAEAYWKAGHRLNPLAYPMAQKLMGLYLATGQLKQGQAVLEAVAAQFPHRLETGLLQAYWSRKLGNTAAAHRGLVKLARLDAQGDIGSDLRWERAQLEFESGRHGNCEKILKAMIQSGEWVREATQLQARIAFFHSRWEEGKRLQALADNLPLQWPKAGSLWAGLPGSRPDGLASRE